MKNKFKLMAILVLSFAFVACANEKKDSNETATNGSKEVNEENLSKEDQANESKEDEGVNLILKRAYKAPHGEGSFARVLVITDGDKIVDSSIDEFQYFDENSQFKALPNQESDSEFKKGNADGKIFASKSLNNEEYSKLMKDKANASLTILDNYKAISDFTKGKTISELEEIILQSEDGKPVDAISSATLVDTKGYLQAIVDTAKDKNFVREFKAKDPKNILLQQTFGTAGANNAITDTFVVVEDGKIIAANIDEFQYMEGVGLPNSDKKFGENFKDPNIKLSSKLENNDEYSKKMMEVAKASKKLDENFKAIEDFVIGKTPEEIKEVVDNNEAGKPVDAVSSATLVNTVGYLDEIYKAASQTK